MGIWAWKNDIATRCSLLVQDRIHRHQDRHDNTANYQSPSKLCPQTWRYVDTLQIACAEVTWTCVYSPIRSGFTSCTTDTLACIRDSRSSSSTVFSPSISHRAWNMDSLSWCFLPWKWHEVAMLGFHLAFWAADSKCRYLKTQNFMTDKTRWSRGSNMFIRYDHDSV